MVGLLSVESTSSYTHGHGAKEAAMTMRGWQPTCVADEVSHPMVHESLHYIIYA